MGQSAMLTAAAPETPAASPTPAPARHRHPLTRLWFEETGEVRSPRAGEWFLADFGGASQEKKPVRLAANVTREVPPHPILRPVPVRRDFSAMPEEGYTGDEWEDLMDAIGSGLEIEVPRWVHDYFLEALPPRWMGRGGFIFAEGADFPTWHWSFGAGPGRRYFAQRFFGEALTPESGAEEMAARLGFTGEEAARFVEIATCTG